MDRFRVLRWLDRVRAAALIVACVVLAVVLLAGLQLPRLHLAGLPIWVAVCSAGLLFAAASGAILLEIGTYRTEARIDTQVTTFAARLEGAEPFDVTGQP